MSAIKISLLALVAAVSVAADAKETKLVAAFNGLLEKAGEAADKLESYVAERTAAELASKVEVCDIVSFTFGRGETKKELRGNVLAVVETPAGKLLKVLAGEGADVKVYDVQAKHATVQAAVTETAQESAVEVAAETPAVDTSAAPEPAGGAAVDVDALIANL